MHSQIKNSVGEEVPRGVMGWIQVLAKQRSI
jgi:hypothetical protein